MKRIAEPVVTEELCSYGCGCVAKYRNGSGNLMCCERHNSCPANKAKNSSGVKKCGRDYSGDYDKLPQEVKERMMWNKGKYNPEFAYGGKIGAHKKVLVQERGHRCEQCGNDKWNGIPITLELEHVDGDCFNNEKKNLKLLCPNCHSQTSTWKRGNNPDKKYAGRVPDETLLAALKTSSNIREALLKVGLSGKGYIYARCYKLLAETNLMGK